MNENFSDYVVFIDESGDSNLKNIDSKFPIFTLVCCIFKVDEYIKLKREIDTLKFNFFGHDDIVFHESDIRNGNGEFFEFFKNKEYKKNFIEELSSIVEKANFKIISTVINKKKLTNKYTNSYDPYKIALQFCLERISFFQRKNNCNKKVNILIEGRNRQDNELLWSTFEKIIENNKYNFSLRTVKKISNNIGLQIADIVARPISLYVLKPDQHNRTHSIILKKFDKNKKGSFEGYGLKKFP